VFTSYTFLYVPRKNSFEQQQIILQITLKVH